MKAKFELKSWMTENREIVIEKYNELSDEKYFNGISLKSFMVEVLSGMIRNKVSDAKRATSMLHIIIGEVYVNNSKVVAEDRLTDALKAKYNGTSFMAMV